MNFTELRLKLRHFVRKNKVFILLIVIVWLVIIIINLLLLRKKPKLEPTTTYEPHVSVINSSKSTPKAISKDIEDLIDKYVTACNEGNFQKAFDYLSPECREFVFENSVEKFMKYILSEMPEPKEYAIQNYSDMKLGDGKKIYIYEVKFHDDYLSTGLTNTEFSFYPEKITFYYDDENNLMMNVGDFIYRSDPDAITENDYLKVDVVDRKVEYDSEIYQVKFMNRSDYTVVIQNREEANEVNLQLPHEVRLICEQEEMVLAPRETKTFTMSFQKFVDDGDNSVALLFNDIRIMNAYSGVGEEIPEETKKLELDNAVAKIRMSVIIDGEE